MSPSSLTVEDAFRHGRSVSHWTDQAVNSNVFETIYEMMRWGPTSANSSPLRVVVVSSPEGKERLASCMIESNVEKVRTAPITVILAFDPYFYDRLPHLYPHTDARSWFAGEENAPIAAETAFRNSSLQAAYFIIAARAAGLDCGPMSGFDADAVEAAFLKRHRYKVNMLCSVGYADESKLHPRGPRLGYDEVFSAA